MTGEACSVTTHEEEHLHVVRCSVCGVVAKTDNEEIAKLATDLHMLWHAIKMLTDPKGVHIGRPR